MVFLMGCAITRDHGPQDTKFKDSERNWLEIYHRELIICINNGDREGFYFFMQEIQNEKRRIKLSEETSE